MRARSPTRIGTDFREAGFDVVELSQVERAALLITIGGDGTLLRAARLAVQHALHCSVSTPGASASSPNSTRTTRAWAICPRSWIAVFYTDDRTALDAEYDGRRFFALNDVVVRKGEISRLAPFGLRVDEGAVTRIAADGINVATPTGSTAYFLSAGGSLIAPNVDAFGVVPLLPHTLFSRPLIVPATFND